MRWYGLRCRCHCYGHYNTATAGQLSLTTLLRPALYGHSGVSRPRSRVNYRREIKVCYVTANQRRTQVMFSYTGWPSLIRQTIFRFHQFSSMNLNAQFQISWVGASLFSGGTVCVSVLMALYQELGVCSCRIIDSQPVPVLIRTRC